MVFKNALFKGRLTDIIVENCIITAMEKTDTDGYDLGGSRVFAGLIDTHIHGCNGYEVIDGDKLCEMSEFLAQNGITSWLPTTGTASMDDLRSAINVEIPKDCGANILGFHMEGPFFSHKYKGALDPRYIVNPDIEEFRTFKNVKKISLAPELDGSMEFIRECGCVVSIAHTEADYDCACEAFKNGASCLTHTFNAMPPLHHRNPGPVGAAIENDAYVEVICDGKHVHKRLIKMLYKTFGPDKMIVISDGLRCAGLADGTKCMSNGLEITVKDGLGRLADGTIAGSASTLMQCVKTLVSYGIPVEDAFKMASETAAKSIGVYNKGVLAVGKDADFIAVDDDLQLTSVVIGGKIIK